MEIRTLSDEETVLSLLFMRFDQDRRADRGYLIFCDKVGFTLPSQTARLSGPRLNPPADFDRMAGVAKRLMWLEIDSLDQCGLHETSCLQKCNF